jgi:hypothetical protein
MSKFRALRLTGLVGHEYTGVMGDKFVFKIPAGYTRENKVNFIAHVEGAVRCERANYEYVDVKQAGDTANTAPWVRPNPGDMTYTVLTPIYRYYCFSRPDGAAITMQDVRLNAGETFDLPVGSQAVLVMGSVESNGAVFHAPSQIICVSTPAVVVAKTDNTLLLQTTI